MPDPIPIQRPALGQFADLGDLYDARSDIFIRRSLFRSEPPTSAFNETIVNTGDVQLLQNDGYGNKFNQLKVNVELGASFLAGAIKASGSALYLNGSRDSNLVEQVSIHRTLVIIKEVLGYAKPELRPYIALDAIRGSGATHVLQAVEWGAQTIATIRYRPSNEQDSQLAKRYVEHEFNRLQQHITLRGNQQHDFTNGQPEAPLQFDITIYSDILPDGQAQTDNLRSTCDFILELPVRTASVNGGRGLPVSYKLIPLEMLEDMLSETVHPDALFVQPKAHHLDRIVALFDEVRGNQRRLNDYYVSITSQRHCIPPQYIESVTYHLNKLNSADQALRSNFARILMNVRSGQIDRAELKQFGEAARLDFLSVKDVDSLTNKYRDKITFINQLAASGIKYFGYGSRSIEAELQRNNVADAFVLYYNDKLRQKSTEEWTENFNLLQKRRRTAPNCVTAVVDCDATQIKLKQVYVSRFRRGRLVVQNVLEQIRYGKCVARYINEDDLDKDAAKRPVRRSNVKIACPGANCDKEVAHDWVCFKCNVLIEYGSADQYIYCDCGRSPHNNYDFKCKELDHGDNFERFDKAMLLQLLDSLDPMDELNILIIGETGVGKSTFINAFINYLTYNTLDEAMANESLDWVIPCSFWHQAMDRNNPDGTIEQTKIQIGKDKDEVDGSAGESATQKTMVYPITLGDTVVRLIDTPGIGDTRGVDVDKQNMANILGMLGNFDKLHGILFLLKSNNSRLNLMFRFVMEELLSHLHRDAALNMVFGFTNTRISNYMPGDTFGPLKKLLEKHKRVQISLSPRTVYCFDSESFRFLAAQKNGLLMENIQDFRLSWEKSERETKRLIEHFRGLPPHFVRQTVSLNQTRNMILHLTKPMADIMQIIDKTILLNTDNLSELEDTKLKGGQLQKRLHWEQIVLIHVDLDHPRTVCNDINCKEFRDDGAGTKQTIYKSHCHTRCYLTDIAIGTVSVSGLKNCSAFDGNENCTLCGHHWENHLHVNHELKDEKRTVKNQAIVDQLAKNASDIEIKQAGIQNLKDKIAEADYEYQEILQAAVQFGIFLKKHAITPYNDAMEDYLKHLIKEEQGKVSVGGSRERLENLEHHLREHVEQVKILSRSMADDKTEAIDEDGVTDLVNHLYSLKLFGKNLREIKEGAEAAFLAEYQERPFRPGRNPSGSRHAHSNGWQTALGWVAGKTGLTVGEPRRMVSTRVAAPYQSNMSVPKNTGVRIPSGGYQTPSPAAGGSTATFLQGQYQTAQVQVAPMREIVPSSQRVPYAVPPPSEKEQRKSSSFTSKFLRPFSRRL